MNLSSSPVGSRRRKRSGSGSGSRSRSRSRIRNTKKGGPPESLRFIYRTYESRMVKFHLLTIPSKEIEFFKQVDVNYYTRHDHSKCDSTNFRDITSIYPPAFLLYEPLTPFSDISIVGENIYFILSRQFGEPLEFWSHSLDPLYSDHKLLAPPKCEHRYFAHSFSLCGKVFLFAGLFGDPDLESQPFGEVYDLDTDTWSPIPRPANSDALISTSQVFVASLGESNAKIMVYDYNISSSGLVYIYDVATQGWITPLVPPKNFEPVFAYTEPVINKDDNLLYWIDERRGFMYALDWKEMNLYSGPVVGMEHARVLSNLKGVYHAVCLNHLWDDYFCLVWSSTSPADADITENHFTFLKVVKYPATDSLVAFVIGCFVDLNRNCPGICDSVCF